MEDKWQTTLQHSFKNRYNSKGTCTQLLIFSATCYDQGFSLSLSLGFSCYDKSTCLLWERLIIKPGNCPRTPDPELP